jgi:iron complex outermembrane receptor protein
MTRMLLAILLCSTTAPAWAVPQATTADTDSATTDGAIIVTAQKRAERQFDVPITISATTGQRLRDLGVSDLDEVAFFVPGLNIQEQSANNPGIVIRGITSDSGSSQQAARVTLYYNGVDISRSRGAYQDLYDIDRIEVVKGPQATLFGTASTVGAISIISNRPKPGLSGELTGGLGNYNQRLLAGHLNAGDDVLAGRRVRVQETRRLCPEPRTRPGRLERPGPVRRARIAALPSDQRPYRRPDRHL